MRTSQKNFWLRNCHCSKKMHPNKAPGPNWMSPIFYQKYQGTVGTTMLEALLQDLNTGQFPRNLNHTHISLIFKKKQSLKVADYLPISLCIVLCKLLSKVLANRIKSLLTSLVPDSQSVFVPKRQISDNILVAYEILHFLKKRKRGRQGSIFIKLDVGKAYDRIEWGYLEHVLVALNFPPHFIHLLILYVNSTTFSIMINEEPRGLISPSRGLRQGDPFSSISSSFVLRVWLAS